MRRRDFFVLVGIATAARVLDANALESGKLYKIGILTAGGPGPLTPLRDMLREDLRELGLIEGKNLAFEGRYAENDLDPLPALAAELVSLEVDLIIAVGTLAPLAAKRATVTIPIVMAAAGDPVGSGLIASLARPGGNVTGTSLMAPDLGGKRLELVKELLPEISRVAVLWNAANPYSALVFKATVGAAWTLAIEVQSLEVRGPADFDGAFEAATGQHIGALIAVEDPLTNDHRHKIAEFAAGKRLPMIAGLRMFAEAGGLMSYGADVSDTFRRSVAYVAKILKGAKPSDLPVEQPTKFELVINLKTAKALGLTIPPLILARADEVIE
jgi:putative tryptophan/tyrosine transport system substrate-binding protein